MQVPDTCAQWPAEPAQLVRESDMTTFLFTA